MRLHPIVFLLALVIFAGDAFARVPGPGRRGAASSTVMVKVSRTSEA